VEHGWSKKEDVKFLVDNNGFVVEHNTDHAKEQEED
jgi:hypothetical protein